MSPPQLAIDGAAGTTSVVAGVFSLVMQDVSIAIFGVPAAVLLAGFAGAMAIVSFLPPFQTRRKMWSTVLVCTLAAAYLTKIFLKLAGWDGGHAIGVGFFIGFSFQIAGQFLVQNGRQLLEAFAARIGGGR